MRVRAFRSAAIVATAACALLVSGCGGDSETLATTTTTENSLAGKIAFMMPETATVRYETHDRPAFAAKLRELCPKCEVVNHNAEGDAKKQASQVDLVLAAGVDVIVLDPIDTASSADMVAKAKAKNVSVISYDRLVQNADLDFFVGTQNDELGRLQAQGLIDKLTKDGTMNKGSIVMLNGDPSDTNATALKKASHELYDGKVKIGKEYDNAGWLPAEAQKHMDEAIKVLGKDNIIGVSAANDGIASGAIASLKKAGVTTMPPVTGQDADLAAIQRMVANEQYSTIYKALRIEAGQAAIVAVDLLKKSKPAQTTTMNNGLKEVPSWLLHTQGITKDDIKNTVIKDGYWTVAQICTAQYADACTKAGLS